MSSAVSGVGTTFKKGSVYISEIISINGPNMSRAVVDVTSLDSVAGYRDFISGMRDGGEISFGMNFTIEGYNQMFEDYTNNVLQDYQVTIDEGGANEESYEMTALVVGMTLSIPIDDKIVTDITMRVF